MKIIIGLGNPGTQYKNTRHNIGQDIVLKILKKYESKTNSMSSKKGKNGDYYRFFSVPYYDSKRGTWMQTEDFYIIISKTFMNLSGECFKEFFHFFKSVQSEIKNQDILVVHDDKDFELGKYKFQLGGSSAGQNGVENIIFQLRDANFSRLRIGIGKPNEEQPLSKFVLSKFKKDDQSLIPFEKIYESIDNFIEYNIVDTMNKYN